MDRFVGFWSEFVFAGLDWRSVQCSCGIELN